jgi:hypothetical protein
MLASGGARQWFGASFTTTPFLSISVCGSALGDGVVAVVDGVAAVVVGVGATVSASVL